MTRLLDDGTGFEVDLDSIDEPARSIIEATRGLFLETARIWLSPGLTTTERVEGVLGCMARARWSSS